LKDKKTLVIKPEEAAIRRKAYELFVQCRRKDQVARELNAAGYRRREHLAGYLYPTDFGRY
jgi:hypothetical protein